ncbi:MAG: hypothetical protein IBJ18_13745 [Phycisphaerales bacterium]|nr:hypothetical protein [Phycisphaerales bacterium]
MNGARAMRGGVVAVALVLSAGLARSAVGQTGANIIRDLRPMVSISLTNPAPGAAGVGMGIFDTGAMSVFIPPSTNSLWGVPIAAGANAFQNFGQVGNPTTLSVGGMFGGSYTGPEQVNAGFQTQAFTAVGNLNRTAPVGTTVTPAVNWYNGRFNNFIVGTSFIGGNGTTRPMVGIVDPINAGYTAFQFGTTNANPAMAGVVADSNERLNNTYTSVSLTLPGVDIPLPLGGSVYLPNLSIPTLNQNFNPSFMFGLSMIAQRSTFNAGGLITGNAPTAAGFTNYSGAANTNNATLNARPFIQVNATAQALLGNSVNANGGTVADGNPMPTGLYLADTGAPGTRSPTVGNPTGLMGTNFFNGFGQFWDFSANPGNNNAPTLLMFGPRLQGDRDLVSTGVLMTVDRSAAGLSRTGVDQYAQFGRPAIMVPGGGTNPDGSANANGTPVPATNVPGVQAQTIFRTHMTQSNAGYISGTEAMNLIAGADQIDGLTVGADPIARRSMIFFSVDNASSGMASGFANVPPTPENPTGFVLIGGQGFGGGVNTQAQLSQQAGDVFQSVSAGRPTPLPGGGFLNLGSNELRFNQDVMGLAGNAGPLADANGWGNRDNLRDFDLQSIQGMNGANAAGVMRNVDPVIRSGGDTFNPAAGTLSSSGGRFDVLGTTFNTFITLDAASPTLGALGASPSDILRNAPVGAGLQVFATGAQAGLLAAMNNDVDAVALDRVNFPGYTGPLFQGLGMVVGPGGYIPLTAFQPYGGLLPDFAGIDRFFNMLSDVMLFSLAPGSVALNFFDPILGRQLSAADIFITDFDGTFQLYASAESMGLFAVDNIDGLDVRPIPAPGAVVLLGVGGLLASRRRRERVG